MVNERSTGNYSSSVDWESLVTVAARFRKDPNDPAFLSTFFEFQQLVRIARVHSFLHVVFGRRLEEAEGRPTAVNERVVSQYQMAIAENEIANNF